MLPVAVARYFLRTCAGFPALALGLGEAKSNQFAGE
jgi:hypothetical protein